MTAGATDYDGDTDDYVVGCGGAAAIPITGDATVIAWVEIAWLGFEGHAAANCLLRGVDGSLSFPDGPGYAAEAGFPSPCQNFLAPLTGGYCAWINEDHGWCSVHANEDMTWGDVKGLY